MCRPNLNTELLSRSATAIAVYPHAEPFLLENPKAMRMQAQDVKQNQFHPTVTAVTNTILKSHPSLCHPIHEEWIEYTGVENQICLDAQDEPPFYKMNEVVDTDTQEDPEKETCETSMVHLSSVEDYLDPSGMLYTFDEVQFYKMGDDPDTREPEKELYCDEDKNTKVEKKDDHVTLKKFFDTQNEDQGIPKLEPENNHEIIKMTTEPEKELYCDKDKDKKVKKEDGYVKLKKFFNTQNEDQSIPKLEPDNNHEIIKTKDEDEELQKITSTTYFEAFEHVFDCGCSDDGIKLKNGNHFAEMKKFDINQQDGINIKMEDYSGKLTKGNGVDRGWQTLRGYPGSIQVASGFDPGQQVSNSLPSSDHGGNNSGVSSSLDHLLGISFMSPGDPGEPNNRQKGWPQPRRDQSHDELDRSDLDILDGFLNEEPQQAAVPEYMHSGVRTDHLAHEEVLRFQAHAILGAQENLVHPVTPPPDTSMNEWNFYVDLFRMSEHQTISPALKEEILRLRRRSVAQHQLLHCTPYPHRPPPGFTMHPHVSGMFLNPYSTALPVAAPTTLQPPFNFSMPSSVPHHLSAMSSNCSSPAPSSASSTNSPSALSSPNELFEMLHEPVADTRATRGVATPAPTTKPPSVADPDVMKNRRLCQHPGCLKRSRSLGLCITHGGGKRCRVVGCNKSSQGGDLCIRHGGGKRCQVDGCTKAAQTNGKCKGHGGGPRCKVLGCLLSSQGNGRCRRHGGGRRCAYMGCDKGTQRGAYCAIHGGSKLCSIDGCHRNDRGGGFCANHGGGRRCVVPGCKNPSRRQGRCSVHFRVIENHAPTTATTGDGDSTTLEPHSSN